jgi:hypothetical protein
MPSRAELDLRARVLGVNPANYPNDSALEQRVLYLEKRQDTVTGTAASSTLTSNGTNVSDGDTVTIGNVTYTFKTTLGTTANQVLIGASAAASLTNLSQAISGSGGTPGTTYTANTTPIPHPDISIGTVTSTTIPITAKSKNYGNSVATTKSATTLSWTGSTLAGGVLSSIAAPTGDAAAVSGDAPV